MSAMAGKRTFAEAMFGYAFLVRLIAGPGLSAKHRSIVGFGPANGVSKWPRKRIL